ncbi:MAG: hypothetical protein H7X93_08410 [Sphingomonadaceae bacterium]|nr:hypothetical protein [Sphingomonadaceae bacterium]
MNKRMWLSPMALAAIALATASCNASAREEDSDEREQSSEEAADDRDEAVDKSAAAEVDLSEARALIEEIYDSLVNEEPMQSEVMSPDLTRTLERSGMMDPEMGLGFDPFCACQDFGNVSYEITRLEPAGEGRATAEVAMTNLGERRVFRLDLVEVSGDPVVEGWRVDDVGAEGEQTLREMAAAASR